MNKILINALAFSVGAAVSSVVTWKIVKTKYERKAKEEIDSVKEAYARKQTALTNEIEKAHKILETKIEQANKAENSKIISNNGYAASTKFDKSVPMDELDRVFNDLASASDEATSTLHFLTDVMEGEAVKKKSDNDKIHVIPPEEFSEYDDYDVVSLTYYADGILTDEDDNIIENIDETVGKGSLNCFGEYEDDSVFVRNDATKTDYEILLDMRKYTDVVSIGPRSVSGDE